MNDMTELELEEEVQEEIETEIEKATDEEVEKSKSESEKEIEEGEESAKEEEQTEESPSDEFEITIGDEKLEEVKESSVIKDFRKRDRDNAKRIRELEDKLRELEAPKVIEAIPEPKLDDPDIDYDPEIYKVRLLKWNKEQEHVEEQKKQKLAQEEQSRKDWEEKVAAYEKAKKELKVVDFEDAEESVKSIFNKTQLGIIVDGADKPEILIYALGKHEVKAKELAAISHPVKFAMAIAKLEEKLKVTQKKAPPPPEKFVSNTGTKSNGSGDSTLDRLRAQAAKSGDYTKVVEYNRSKKK